MKNEVLIIIVIEKEDDPVESVISPFLNDQIGITFFIIDNNSSHDALKGLDHQFPFIRLHRRPSTIHRAMAYNIALEVALTEGYKGVFLWDISTPFSPGYIRELSNWSNEQQAIGITLPEKSSNSIYIPYSALLEIGIFNPFINSQGIKDDLFNRLKCKDLKVGYFSDNSLNEPSKRVKNNIYRSLMSKEYSNLKKSSTYWVERPKIDLEGLSRAIKRTHLAPVLLLVYNRPEHTKRLLHDFWTQPEAPQTPLYILSDGGDKVDEVREICIKEAEKHPNITLWCQEYNQGLAKNVIEGIERVLDIHDCVIVLEDDLRLSPYFLRWMNDSLDKYKNQKQIAHLHAGTFYSSPLLPNNHSLLFAGSWGWATWKDRWEELWEPDGQKLLTQLLEYPHLIKHFNYGGYMNFTRMLRHQIKGLNNSWAIRWHASLLLNNRLSINSNPPLVSNDGFDGSGTHSSGDDRYNTGISPYPVYAIQTDTIPTEESKLARKVLRNYYRRTNNKCAKGWYKIKEILKRI